jgi:DNA-binding transcriptional LysR family regulator
VDLVRLRTFQALCETLHFRRAAERLGITQSAVSQQISALEKDLGATLFERMGRRVYLTAAGEVLAREAVKVLSTVSRAREAVGTVSKGDAGRLRVGASTTPGIYLLPEVLGRFRADFPHVELEFRIENSSPRPRRSCGRPRQGSGTRSPRRAPRASRSTRDASWNSGSTGSTFGAACSPRTTATSR